METFQQDQTGSVDRRALLGLSAGLIGVAALAHKASAGPIVPPAGPVGPTGRTLTEIEPRTPVHTLPGDASNVHVISQSGNYYLTGDIVRVPGKTAIRIAADFVTLDLNGFSMIGNRGTSGGIESAIEIASSRTGVVVRNGYVRGWPFYGLIGYGQRCRFENLLIEDNHAGGLEVFTPFSLVHRCIVQNSAEVSIGAGHGAVITECVVFGGNQGIVTGEASVVRDCTVHNAGTAIELGSGIVERCTVRCIAVAGSRGIVATQGARIEGNTITGCSDTGIKAQFGSYVSNNVVRQCGIGIDAVGGGAVGSVGGTLNRVQGNNLGANTTGIRALNGGTMVVGNTVSGSGAQSYNLVAGNPSGAIRNDPAAAVSPLDNFAF